MPPWELYYVRSYFVQYYLQLTKNCEIIQDAPKKEDVKNFFMESGFGKEVGINYRKKSSIPAHNGSHTYKINNCGIHEPGCNGEVTITFINGYFSHADYPFSGHHTEAQWEVLEAISQKIKSLKN